MTRQYQRKIDNIDDTLVLLKTKNQTPEVESRIAGLEKDKQSFVCKICMLLGEKSDDGAASEVSYVNIPLFLLVVLNQEEKCAALFSALDSLNNQQTEVEVAVEANGMMRSRHFDIYVEATVN